MIRRTTLLLATALTSIGVLLPAVAQAEDAPAWSVGRFLPELTNWAPNGSPFAVHNGYFFAVYNSGGAPTSGPITVADTLPDGAVPVAAEFKTGFNLLAGETGACTVGSPTAEDVICTVPGSVKPSGRIEIVINLDTSALATGAQLTNQISVTGGGAAPAQASNGVTVSAERPAFDFLPGANGFSASLSDADGLPSSLAGSHPVSFFTNLSFPLEAANALFAPWSAVADGGVRDAHTALPRGLVVNPQATVRCTEAQLEGSGCPRNSAVGLVHLNDGTFLGGYGEVSNALYNMTPPPGYGAALGFNAANVNLYPHILGGVHAGDYALAAGANDILQRFGTPVQAITVELWGDPTNPLHDAARGECGSTSVGSDGTGICHIQGPECGFEKAEDATKACPPDPQRKPLITMPTSCAGSLPLEAEVDSWGHPGDVKRRSSEVIDSLGNPTGVTGCESLEFKPTFTARPTTSVADSASGLEFDLHIPQPNSIGSLAEAHLKDARFTLPEGMTLNPASANGLAGCSPAQIGIDASTGVANGNPVACPEAAKVGTVEISTPLLDHPAPGAVYVANSYDNPFHSLLAIYVTVDDPATGTLVKLAGKVEPDPNTGRLTTVFSDTPQLPFEDFKLEFFGGAGGVLRTPAICGSYSTTSDLVPWSGGEAAHPQDDYSISQAPGGGSCPTAKGTEPNAPSFDAGTISPIAGAYSPMVVNLRRNDGSQEFSKLSLSPPPGLVGKLAGIAYCPDSALAAAASKSGHAEQAAFSCPAASRVGTVTVGAGPAPAPYYTTGTAYLTGPYKGAPLGLAIVTPAVAGPYDLGTVVVRTALYVDPETTKITAVSDDIPHILQGIRLDVRSVQVKLDRSQFTLNGTSCDPFSFDGSLTSVLGQIAPLSSRFQLGECGALPFKPKLALRLKGKTARGANPGFSATLTMPQGNANIAKAVVTLPRSEFLDNSHIGTVCTRVQFAAGAGHGAQCPAASAYGFAKAISPLLDKPVEGPVFLRSSNHELPDLVAALSGQIEVDLDGRIDSVKGGIRNSFEVVPDAPVTKFTLTMAGGKKGLLQNSTNICRGSHRATVEFSGQNGKLAALEPTLINSKCSKHKKQKRTHKRHARR